MEFPSASTTFKYSKPELTTVEVILLSSDNVGHRIQMDETSEPINIPKYGIKIKDRVGIYATLCMTEDRATSLELI